MTRLLPAVGPPPRLIVPALVQTRLPSGLTIAVVERRDLPIVDVQVVLRRGAAADPPEMAGRTYLTAELVDEGTASWDALRIAEEIDYLGAELNIEASWDAITASLHVLSPRLDAALAILADITLNATFAEDEFRRKKAEHLSALLQEADEPRLIAHKALVRAVFGSEHPYGVTRAGTQTSIQQLSRAVLIDVYQQVFTADNAFVIVVGDVDSESLIARLEQLFGDWHTGSRPASALPPIPSERARLLLVDKPRAAQAEVRVGHTGPARSSADYFTLLVLNTLLGGAFTSRLNMRLREEMGVTYGARSQFSFRRVAGAFEAGAAVFTEAAAESVRVTLQEMQNLRAAAVPVAELQRAQNYLAFGLPRAFESTEDIARHLREQLLYELPPDYWQTFVDRILAVTAKDVHAAALRYLQPDRVVAVVVAERGQVEADLRRLKVAELELVTVPV